MFYKQGCNEVGKYREAWVSVQILDLKSLLFGNCVLILYYLILNMLTVPYWSQAHRGQNYIQFKFASPKQYFAHNQSKGMKYWLWNIFHILI